MLQAVNGVTHFPAALPLAERGAACHCRIVVSARDAIGGQTSDSIRLRLGAGSWILVTGAYLIGRSAECHIVIDSPKVSRRHAALSVSGREVTVRDCESANGVYVNGRAIGQAAVALKPGDRFVVGDAEFTLETAQVSALHSSADTLPPDRASAPPEAYRTTSGTFVAPPRAPSGIDPASSASPEVTAKRHALELLGTVADRAIAAGSPLRAEELMRPRLDELLRKAKARKELDPDTRVQAVRWCLRLSIALKRTTWLEHGVELLTLTRSACDASTLALLGEATQTVPFDAGPFRNYAVVLRDLGGSLDKVATERFVSGLLASSLTR